MNPNLHYVPIGSILLNAQYGISIEMNEEGKGYPIYRMNEIHNMLCDFEVDKCADISFDEFQKFELQDRDVLFNRTNSFEWVGRTGIYRKQAGKDFVFASYLVRFIPDESFVLPEYLTTFLNTKFGVWDIKRRARHSINQTNVNPEEVKAIQIPLFSLPFQYKLKALFDTAYQNLQKSQTLYQQAETELLEALGLGQASLPTAEPVSYNIKNFSDSFLSAERIDAEYYQKKYEYFENTIIAYSGNNRLGDLIEYVFTGEYSEEYLQKDEGLHFYIRSTNIKNGQVEEDTDHFVKTNGFTKFAQKGDILTARVGSLGVFGAVNEKIAGSVYSDNVLCFKLHPNLEPNVYTLWFNSKVNFELIDRLARGSVQQRLNQETLKSLLVPILPTQLQTRLASLVQESFALRQESDALLALAKHAVETAIEAGEAEAEKMLSHKTMF